MSLGHLGRVRVYFSSSSLWKIVRFTSAHDRGGAATTLTGTIENWASIIALQFGGSIGLLGGSRIDTRITILEGQNLLAVVLVRLMLLACLEERDLFL